MVVVGTADHIAPTTTSNSAHAPAPTGHRQVGTVQEAVRTGHAHGHLQMMVRRLAVPACRLVVMVRLRGVQQVGGTGGHESSGLVEAAGRGEAGGDAGAEAT